MRGPIWHGLFRIILKDSPDKAVLYFSLIVLNEQRAIVNGCQEKKKVLNLMFMIRKLDFVTYFSTFVHMATCLRASV